MRCTWLCSLKPGVTHPQPVDDLLYRCRIKVGEHLNRHDYLLEDLGDDFSMTWWTTNV
jgi:hypothetical protein